MGIFATAAFILRHPITRQRPLRSLGDWFRFQVGSRLVPGKIAVPWVGGTRLLVASGMAGATGNVYVGLHELEEMAFLLHLLRPGELMLDVGANIGSYTVLAAGAVGASVHAFEPVAAALAHLGDNVRVNGLEALVAIHPVAVGAAIGELRMEIGRDSANRVVLSGDESEHTTAMVPVVTLDDTFADASPSLIKVDVEGHEAAVFAGAQSLLTRTMAVICEVSREPELVFGALLAAGLKPVSYDPLTRRLVALAAPACNDRGNTIWVRDLAAAAERCRLAPRYAVKHVLL